MKFNLEINFGTDGMLDYDDLASALGKLARKFDTDFRECRDVVAGVNSNVRDGLGDTVGHWSITATATHGIDDNGKPFAYDTEPLPLLNPGLCP